MKTYNIQKATLNIKEYNRQLNETLESYDDKIQNLIGYLWALYDLELIDCHIYGTLTNSLDDLLKLWDK